MFPIITHHFLHDVIFVVILIFLELRVFSKIFSYVCGSFEPIPFIPLKIDNDEDVQKEEDRIKAMNSVELVEHNLVLRNLTKLYGKFRAVNQISVAVERFDIIPFKIFP